MATYGSVVLGEPASQRRGKTPLLALSVGALAIVAAVLVVAYSGAAKPDELLVSLPSPRILARGAAKLGGKLWLSTFSRTWG
jgi:hypothetical protein